MARYTDEVNLQAWFLKKKSNIFNFPLVKMAAKYANINGVDIRMHVSNIHLF